MGKIVIPKNSASLEEVMGAMQIYYDANEWVQNSDFIQTYKERIGIIGDDNDSSAYTKKTEIGAYYGFLEWEDINKTQSPRRITPRGKVFLEHYNNNDMEAVHEDIMRALEEVTFGRNNFACRSCDSDVEPPALFLRAMIDLSYLTNTEFAYLVYKMEYEGQHYTEILQEIRQIRDNDNKIELPDDARKFSDPKPILMLERWGVLTSQQAGEKRTMIAPSFLEKYRNRIQNLKIYNIDKDVIGAHSNVFGDSTADNRVQMFVKNISSNRLYTVDELVEALYEMYTSADSRTQSNAIRMFGFKYAESIMACGVSPQKIVDDSDIDSNSYGAEIQKGINMYNSIKNNEYGITFADTECSTIGEKPFSASAFLSKEWFKEMANNYPEFDEKANELISTFNEKFNPNILEKLSGLDLLNNVFLNPDNPDNLCRALEFNPELTEFFGSIKGGNSYKYGLFYSSNGMWMTGSHQKPRELTQDEAINIGTEIRDRLVAGARVISSYGPVNEIDDYKKLYKLLEEATNGDINKVWFMKYYQMLYPELFAPNYSDYAQRIVLGSLGIEKEKYPLVRMGQIRFFANECELSNVLFSKIFWDNYEEPVIEEETSNDVPITFNTGYKSKFARNRILFGAPGTGKSFTLNGDRKEILYGNREVDESTIDLSQYGEYERVTFHPDYSYANFVGTYKPVPCKDENGKDGITYEYVPGPFMRTYVKALLNSKTETPKPYLLIIEEINRANVAAVFGDVFQLLDRGEDEVSEYPIQASEDMKKYLAKTLGGVLEDYAEIRIPDNMFIWATMNSADQGVFPMDTAFKRRWDFTYLGIDDSEEGISGKTVLLGMKKGTQDHRRVVEWNELRKAINEELLKYKVNEDKLMGPYFISKKNLPEGNIIDPEEFSRIFKNKVIMYLFDDAAKQKRASLFEGCEEKSRNQYSKICNEFDEKGVLIFGSTISDRFTVIPEDDEQ